MPWDATTPGSDPGVRDLRIRWAAKPSHRFDPARPQTAVGGKLKKAGERIFDGVRYVAEYIRADSAEGKDSFHNRSAPIARERGSL
eukprot:15260594-Alexandrium_andersonii.AAC.1